MWLVACLDFEIIEVYSNFVVTHRQTHKLSTVPSAHTSVGNDDSMEDAVEKWVTIEMMNGFSFFLSVFDKMALLRSEGLLNDKHCTTTAAPGTKGLQIAVSQTKTDYELQIIHNCTNHWVLHQIFTKKIMLLRFMTPFTLV